MLRGSREALALVRMLRNVDTPAAVGGCASDEDKVTTLMHNNRDAGGYIAFGVTCTNSHDPSFFSITPGTRTSNCVTGQHVDIFAG